MNPVYKKVLSTLLSAALLFGLFGAAAPFSVSAASEEEPIVLLPGNSEWRYFDKGVDQGTVWQSTYDDSAWSLGNAPLGYKYQDNKITTTKFGGLKTIVDYGTDRNKKYRTTYLRKNLNIDKDVLDQYGQLLGTFAIDDGAVLYVNGTEIERFGMPEGKIIYDTPAASNKDLPVMYNAVNLTAKLKSALRQGSNEFAVEVHQQSDGSSDLYFDMELTALL